MFPLCPRFRRKVREGQFWVFVFWVIKNKSLSWSSGYIGKYLLNIKGKHRNTMPNVLFLHRSFRSIGQEMCPRILLLRLSRVYEEFPSVLSFELHYRISFIVHPNVFSSLNYVSGFEKVCTKADMEGLDQFRDRGRSKLNHQLSPPPLEVFNKPFIVAGNQTHMLTEFQFSIKVIQLFF